MQIGIQFLRYATVGLLSNFALYLGYLLLTHWGMGHKLSMSLLYVMGVLQTFIFNRNWSFRHGGRVSASLTRYVICYALGYAFNLLVLLVLVDSFGLPHQVVQGVMILTLAVLLFLAQRYWVFPQSRPGYPPEPEPIESKARGG